MLPCSCKAPPATPSRNATGIAAVVLKSIENNGHSTAVQRERRAAAEVRVVDGEEQRWNDAERRRRDVEEPTQPRIPERDAKIPP